MTKIYQKTYPGIKNAAEARLGGFTLIELLVVILIIGILAGVALPQYEYAVRKARFQKMVPMVDGLVKAQKSYFMANGNYSSDVDALDISLPENFVRNAGATGASDGVMSCTGVYNFNPRTWCQLLKKQDLVYMYFFTSGRRACVVFNAQNQTVDEFCRRYTGKQTYETYGVWRVYYIDD